MAGCEVGIISDLFFLSLYVWCFLKFIKKLFNLIIKINNLYAIKLKEEEKCHQSKVPISKLGWDIKK